MADELRVLREHKAKSDKEKSDKKRAKITKRREAAVGSLRPVGKQVKTLPQNEKDEYEDTYPVTWII